MFLAILCHGEIWHYLGSVSDEDVAKAADGGVHGRLATPTDLRTESNETVGHVDG